MSRRLEEQLRSSGRVDAIVEVATAGTLRLFHAGVAAAVVGHAGGADFLAADGRGNVAWGGCLGSPRLQKHVAEIFVEPVAGHDLIPGGSADVVELVSNLG